MSNLFVLNGGAAIKPGLRGAMLNIPDPRKFFREAGINTGDVLVYDATLKQLDYDSISNVQFSHAGNEAQWPKEQPDVTIIRGSNYLTATLDLGHVIPLLKHLKGPIVPIGVGAQAGSYEKLTMPKASIEAWRIIASKCETLAVRGFYSAEVFNDIGIKNLRVIGCPSFYRGLQPSITLRKVDGPTARIGLTLNKYLSADYASSTVKTNRVQRALLEAVATRPDSRLYSQGEREESLACYTTGDEQAALIHHILKSFALEPTPELMALFGQRMAAHFDVDAWTDDVGKNVDCMFGFRLHGNVTALQQGIPAVFYTYDSRIRELASLFQVPAIDIDEFQPVDLNQAIAAADFNAFERAYKVNYGEYLRFLNENGLRHRLPPALPTDAAQTSAPNRVKLRFTEPQMYSWMLGELNHLAHSNEVLRTRAWNFEVKLRALKGEMGKENETSAA